ncbi:hypothetical protein PSN45_004356 [Yamadazyma tenuis]|uniref:uncharacterized protein n=1 Tax=Candida tenuis TaxID=2315449 RepID=UPI0027A86FCC|nr:hypothetical protein PSN45_004356 [Yamadazyma tenuis]
MVNRNKRNLEISSIYSSDCEDPVSPNSKKIDTPLSSKTFEGFANISYELEMSLVELITGEIEFYSVVRLVVTVFQSLLVNVDAYNNIFSTSEQNLIFDNISQITRIHKGFVVSMIKELARTSLGTKYNSNLDDDDCFNVNVQLLVFNCNREKLDVGKIFNETFFATPNYGSMVMRLVATTDFTNKIISEKGQTFKIVNKWLTESSRLIQRKSCSVKLESLLAKPIDNLYRYPHILKKIMDNSQSENKHSLGISLIKINKVLDRIYETPKITSWEALRDFSVSPKGYQLDNNLEYRVDSEDEFRLSKAKLLSITQPREVNLQLIKLNKVIKERHKASEKFENQINELVKTSSTFTRLQIKHAQNWNLVLLGEDFFDFVYHQYQKKLSEFAVSTSEFQKSIFQDILPRVHLCRSYLQDTIKCARKIDSFRQKRSDHNLRLENQLIDKLPHLLKFVTEFTKLIIWDLNRHIIEWLQSFVGMGKIREYEILKSRGCTDHSDIVDFYIDRCLNADPL